MRSRRCSRRAAATTTPADIKPELHESVLEIATKPCRDMREAGAELRGLRRQVAEVAAKPRPHDRLRRHAPVRAVGGPAHLRPPALPRPDRGAALRRAPGGHLRPARPRRDRRRRQGDPRRQRDARARRAAARAVGQLAVLARRRHRAGLRPDADLPPVPARRDAARLQGLGRLRAPHRLHGRLEGDGGLHLPLVRRPPAPELRDGRDPRDGRADAGRAHARRSRR